MYIIFLWFTAMIESVNQANASEEHTYTQTLIGKNIGLLKSFLWPVSGTAIHESCSSFHSWLHSECGCDVKSSEEGRIRKQKEKTTEENRANKAKLMEVHVSSAACWTKTWLWVLWHHAGLFLLSAWWLSFQAVNFWRSKCRACCCKSVFFLPLSGWCC